MIFKWIEEKCNTILKFTFAKNIRENIRIQNLQLLTISNYLN